MLIGFLAGAVFGFIVGGVVMYFLIARSEIASDYKEAKALHEYKLKKIQEQIDRTK